MPLWPMSFAEWRACSHCGVHVVWAEATPVDTPEEFAVLCPECAE